ncbi:Structural maintenance of chromosomes protein 5, partial [Serendipita sp. 399]
MSGISENLALSVKKEAKKEKASKAGREKGSGKPTPKATTRVEVKPEPVHNRRRSGEEEVFEAVSNDQDTSNDEDEDVEMEDRRSRKRLKGANGRARPSEVADSDNERSTYVPAVKVFQRDPKDGAEALTAFVKHGYDKGFVEIELKGAIGKPNVVIRRNITTMSNASTWTLNGKNSNKRTVEDRVAALGIQVSNLCSFLPQDRVNEFAKLKPEELLAETQKVAGHADLKKWHDLLKDLGKSFADVKESLAADQQTCASEEGRNQLLEREVVIFNKRKKLEEDLAFYEMLIPWYKYKQNKTRIKACKLAYRQAGIKLATAREEFEPATRFKDKLETKLQVLNREAVAIQEEVQGIQKKVDRLKRDDRRIADQCTEIQDSIAALNKDEQDSRNKIQKLEGDIQRFEKQLDEHKEVSERDTKELLTKKEALSRQIRQIERQRNDLAETMRELDGRIRDVESDQRRARDELKRLEDKTEQRQINMSNTNDSRFR